MSEPLPANRKFAFARIGGEANGFGHWHAKCYIKCLVKLQLTQTKTIEINLPGLGGSKKSKKDLVGVEMFSGRTEGCPTVRLYRKKDMWHLAAVGFTKPPDGEMPECWEDVAKQPSWELPRQFQAPNAALAVNSDMGSFGQASADAIIQDMMRGLTQGSAGPTKQLSDQSAGKKRLGIKRSLAAPQTPAQQTTAIEPASAKRPLFPDYGVPVSENGRRFAVRPFADEGFHLAASLPEFQALWLGRLLPEGKRPTACSIQVAESALMASVLAQPAFIEEKGNALALIFRDHAAFFAGYKNGEPVLWRRCPGNCGYHHMREAVKKTLGVEDALVDSVLEESLIDPRPALEPFLHPVLEQLELARAYLAGKQAMNADKVLLLGLPRGAEHLRLYAEETLKLKISAPDPFEGITADKGVETDSPHAFLVALGAALAAAEVEVSG